MIALHDAVADYLTMRRALGFKLQRPERLLGQFADYLNTTGIDTITTDAALAWARLPVDTNPSWWARRLSAVRAFARHLHALDPAHEVPPPQQTNCWSRQDAVEEFLPPVLWPFPFHLRQVVAERA